LLASILRTFLQQVTVHSTNFRSSPSTAKAGPEVRQAGMRRIFEQNAQSTGIVPSSSRISALWSSGKLERMPR
jgi:hypothetical protein